MLINNNANFKKYKQVSLMALILWSSYLAAYLSIKNNGNHYYPGVLALVGQVMCDGIALVLVIFSLKESQNTEKKVLKWFALSFLCAFVSDSIYNVLVNILVISNITTFLDSLFDIPFLGFLIFQVLAWWAIIKELFRGNSLRQLSSICIPASIFGILIAVVFIFAFQWKINATSIMGLYQIGATVFEIIGFIFAVICFTTSQTGLLRILATGYLTIITSDFIIRTGFIEKSVIPENLFEAVWVLGLILMILGLWGIKLNKIKIQNCLYKTNSIQVQCTSWAFVFCLLVFFVLLQLGNVLAAPKVYLLHLENVAPILVVISIFVLWGSYLFSRKLFQPIQAIEVWINNNDFRDNSTNYDTLKQDYGIVEYNNLAQYIRQSFLH